MKYLIVGLGNPGDEYKETRHNIGYNVLDAFAEASNVVFQDKRYGYVAYTSVKNCQLVLLKPTTFMNLSGNAVRYWLQKLDLPLENLIVISDDLNLPFGTLRMRLSGSDGGHNGLENIIWTLESDQWARIRVGIGNGFSRGAQVDYVLGSLSQEELDQVPAIARRIVQGIKDYSTIGPQKAMTFINTKPKPPVEAPEMPEN